MEILQQNQIREETQLTNEILCCPMQEGNRMIMIHHHRCHQILTIPTFVEAHKMHLQKQKEIKFP
jgi:hypothetical protein